MAYTTRNGTFVIGSYASLVHAIAGRCSVIIRRPFNIISVVQIADNGEIAVRSDRGP